MLECVILSEAKNLALQDSLAVEQTQSWFARDEILRFAQNDIGQLVRYTTQLCG
jgi:hypothetical protein